GAGSRAAARRRPGSRGDRATRGATRPCPDRGRAAAQHGRQRGAASREGQALRRSRRRAYRIARRLLGRAPHDGRGRVGDAGNGYCGRQGQGAGRSGGGSGDPPVVSREAPVMRRVGWIVVVALTAAVGAVGWVYLELHRSGPPVTAPVTVTIEPGKRFADVAR